MIATPLIALAPMEGVTDFATRLWFRALGPFATVGTPFLRVTATFPSSALPPRWAPEAEEGDPHGRALLFPQLMGSDFARLVRVGRLVLERFAVVELNCGCPSPTVFRGGAGSSLLADPTHFGHLICTLAEELGPRRLAVKVRLGVSTADEWEALFAQLVNLDLARITIHGRTRAEGYQGYADWERIGTSAAAAKAPVWGSGDVLSLATAERLSQIYPSLGGILIGRGALRNPLFFFPDQPVCGDEIADLLTTYGDLHRVCRADAAKHLGALTPARSWPEWLSFRQRVATLAATLAPDPEHERALLGRLKLHYHYLRSSIDFAHAPAPILRARSTTDFDAALRHAVATRPRTPLRPAPSWDWLYTGAGRDKTPQRPAILL